ncbi:hypothetical protein KP509_08G058000 [Ceratopteris richardii]|uniref:GAG-pre-integrase domain-containing protein n=1 Tax=Ceratopteris richardii TaxID=49495 RepID=A0A8T2U737_CERRI|nr:hypothetical protein KP509_08G058000 [Ceratopteris richardii]
MTSHAQYFSNIDDSHNGTILTVDSTPNSIVGKGDIPIRLGTGEKKTLDNVLLVPLLTKNLLSVGTMTEKGLRIEFEGQQCLIKDPKNSYKVVARGRKQGKRFKLEGEVSAFSAMGNDKAAPIMRTELWHKRYGHLNFNSTCMLKEKGMVIGIQALQRIRKVCEARCLGKHARSKFSKSSSRAHDILVCWCNSMAYTFGLKDTLKSIHIWRSIGTHVSG